MVIGLSSDHGGVNLKERIKMHLEAKGIKVMDYGTNGSESVDYPDYGKLLGEKVVAMEVDLGIAICGTGIGIGLVKLTR